MSSREDFNTIVIRGGQAGLATSIFQRESILTRWK
jgi:hypothetical protein